jgi:Tol biopolymer transport system component
MRTCKGGKWALSRLLVTFTLLAGMPAWGANQTIEPQEFASGVISTGHEFGITFTPDGKEAYFSRFALNQATHIFRSRLIAGTWQQPERISISGDAWSDLDPFVSFDGKQLFFISTRPESDALESHQKNMDIWVAQRNGRDWIAPRRVENVNSDGKEGSPSVAADGTMYFFSDRKDGPGKNAIYESRCINGVYSTPILLPPTINSGTSNTSPFIARDGKTLLFYSTRLGGYGKADLYVSFKQHGKWSEASNLGPVVNSGESDYNPAVSPDGQYFFFGRNSKLYVVPMGAILSLTSKRFR